MTIFLTADKEKETGKDAYSIPSFACAKKTQSVNAKTEDGADLSTDAYIRLKKKKSFTELLFEKIDGKGMTDPAVYNTAGIDRKYFGKIRKGRVPVRKTVIRLALAMRLDIAETEELLNAAGYTLTMSRTSDMIIRHCILNGNYNITKINIILHDHRLPLL